MGERDAYVGVTIKRLNDVLQRWANDDMRSADMTLSQMKVLLELLDAKDHTLSFTQLKSILGVAQPTVWGLVKRLEKKGLVETSQDPMDARAHLVTITKAGLSTTEIGRSGVIRDEEKLLATLSPEEQVQVRDLLLRMYKSIT